MKDRIKKTINSNGNIEQQCQYSRRECKELHKMSTSIRNQDLRKEVGQILTLIGVSVKQEELPQCPRIKKKKY